MTALRRVGVPALLAAASIVLIGAVRVPAESMRTSAKETSESYGLPPPDQLVRASLGYRAALADYLWAHVLVTQGLRLKERRRYEHVTRYIDAITTLDPDFREPYRLADTLTTMQAKPATVEDVREARRLLERGVERFPNDAELWLSLGAFVTFLAPASYLDAHDPKEAERWRVEGAAYLARAAELGSHDASIAWRAIGGVRHLHKAGEARATIQFIERAIAVTEDEELRAHLMKQLAALAGEEAAERQRGRRAHLEALWRRAYPTWSLTAVHVAGPPVDPALCAGGSLSPAHATAACATRWDEWARRTDAEIFAIPVAP